MQTVSRLINTVKPINYKLTLDINKQKHTFSGNEVISAVKTTKQKEIRLHSKDLIIKSITINSRNCAFELDANDELVVKTDTKEAENFSVEINFEGKITDGMHGMYPCYFTHDNKQKELIATQFESHHAREVFPCVDEPEAKATYDLTLITENNITVLSNSNIKKQYTDNNRLVTTFETTPKMSSYLLAWVYGEMHKKSAISKTGIITNVWSTISQPLNRLDFALDIATKSIDFYSEYFKTPYPLTKCDHVALPDFSSGAMENWGLITYRETALLVDEKDTSIASKNYVATVIAHELSHQWFGNLVTMKWWDDLWLNESFATLVEYTCVDSLKPTWNMWQEFIASEGVYSLRRDSFEGVQSVKTDVNHPDEISTLFDGAIVYAKGARLLQMLINYIGEDNFREGIKNYFAKFAYHNTIDSDLWNELQKTSQIDVAKFMDNWLKKPGFPVVSASLELNELTISQEKLVSLNSKKSDQLWKIPLNSNQNDVPKILDKKSVTLPFNGHFIRLNNGSTGYFVTSYDEGLFEKIIGQIKDNKITEIDQISIINDQLILTKAGKIKYSKLLKLIEIMSSSQSDIVWDMISLAISDIKKIVGCDDRQLKSFAQKISNDLFNELGMDQKSNDTENIVKLRTIICSLALFGENKTADKLSLDKYKKLDLEKIDANIRALVISNYFKYRSNLGDTVKMIKKYCDSSVELQLDICAGITSTSDIESIDFILNTITNSKIIRNQDVIRWVSYLMRNHHARKLTWNWMVKNWKWIEDSFGGDKSYDYFPQITAKWLNTEEQFNEYSEFFSNKLKLPALKRSIEIGLHEIKDNVAVTNFNHNDLINKLSDF